MLGAMIDLESVREEDRYPQVTGGQYLQTSSDCLELTGHSNFTFRECGTPRVFCTSF